MRTEHHTDLKLKFTGIRKPSYGIRRSEAIRVQFEKWSGPSRALSRLLVQMNERSLSRSLPSPLSADDCLSLFEMGS
jgi:hypothetical protein